MPAYSVADSSSRGTRCPGGSITRRRGWCEDPSTGSGRRSCSPAEHITSAGPVAWQHRGELLAPVRSLFGAPVNGHCFTTDINLSTTLLLAGLYRQGSPSRLSASTYGLHPGQRARIKLRASIVQASPRLYTPWAHLLAGDVIGLGCGQWVDGVAVCGRARRR